MHTVTWQQYVGILLAWQDYILYTIAVNSCGGVSTLRGQMALLAWSARSVSVARTQSRVPLCIHCEHQKYHSTSTVCTSQSAI